MNKRRKEERKKRKGKELRWTNLNYFENMTFSK